MKTFSTLCFPELKQFLQWFQDKPNLKLTPKNTQYNTVLMEIIQLKNKFGLLIEC